MRIRLLPAAVVATAAVAATVVASLTVVAVPAQAAAAPEPPRRIVTGWLPYWTPTSSTDVLVANKDLFTDSSPFWFTASSATTIKAQLDAATRASVTARIHAAGIPVIPTVTDSLPAHGMAAALTNPTTRAQHVSALVSTVVANGYDGIDLDYEKFAFSDGSSTWAATRPAWVAFVKQLAASLHAHGKRLTVAVPYMDGVSSGYWVYDYKGIGPYVDRLRIMTYDYNVAHAGPIAPISWVTKVAAFAATQVPPSKVQIGVPTYGYDWPLSTAGCPVDNKPKKAGYTAAQSAALAAKLHIAPTWNPTYGERTFSYHATYSGHSSTGAAATCTIVRTVWYDDASAVALRARLVGRYSLGGVAFWTVGGEDPAQWGALRAYARTIAPTPSRLAYRVGAGTVRYGSSTTVYGAVTRKDGTRFDGVPVELQAHLLGTNMWTTQATLTSNGAGYVGFPVSPKADTEYRLVVPGSFAVVGSTGRPMTVRVQIAGSLMYVTPHMHEVGTQTWMTLCYPYNTGIRCQAFLWATLPVRSGSHIVMRTGWFIHRTTYVDHASALWNGNARAKPGTYVAGGQTYTVLCTPSVATGPRQCQTWMTQSVIGRAARGWVARPTRVMVELVRLS